MSKENFQPAETEISKTMEVTEQQAKQTEEEQLKQKAITEKDLVNIKKYFG